MLQSTFVFDPRRRGTCAATVVYSCQKCVSSRRHNKSVHSRFQVQKGLFWELQDAVFGPRFCHSKLPSPSTPISDPLFHVTKSCQECTVLFPTRTSVLDVSRRVYLIWSYRIARFSWLGSGTVHLQQGRDRTWNRQAWCCICTQCELYENGSELYFCNKSTLDGDGTY